MTLLMLLFACPKGPEKIELVGTACRDGNVLMAAAAVDDCPDNEAELFCTTTLDGLSERVLFVNATGSARECPVIDEDTSDTDVPPPPPCAAVTAVCGEIITLERLVDDGTGEIRFDQLPSCNAVCN